MQAKVMASITTTKRGLQIIQLGKRVATGKQQELYLYRGCVLGHGWRVAASAATLPRGVQTEMPIADYADLLKEVLRRHRSAPGTSSHIGCHHCVAVEHALDAALDEALVKACQDRRRHRAATVIQRRWMHCYYYPRHRVCRRRLVRELYTMAIEVANHLSAHAAMARGIYDWTPPRMLFTESRQILKTTR